MSMNQKNVYLSSKPRYEILDGLRGVASVAVVLFHLFETYASSAATQIINHGYLAVDFPGGGGVRRTDSRDQSGA